MDEFKSDMEYRDLLRYSGSLTLNGRSFCMILNEWIQCEGYKRHYNKDKGQWYECETFTEFFEVSPPRGLGLDFLSLKDELVALSSVTGDAKAIIQQYAKEGGKRVDVAKKLNVSHGRISQIVRGTNNKPESQRRRITLPTDPAKAAAKIKEKFGSEFAINLKEAL